MKRRRHLSARLDRLSPPPVGGGVLYIEDIESGAVQIDELPRGRGGYLLVNRPCTEEEWIRLYGGAHAPFAPRKETL